MTMGEKIKRLRIEAGLTQEDVGNAVGLKKAAINKYETGRVENMKRSTIAELARLFGVNPVWLISDDLEWPPEDAHFSSHRNQYTDPADLERLEALHQNPRLGLLFDHTRRMSSQDVDVMIRFAEGILKDLDK